MSEQKDERSAFSYLPAVLLAVLILISNFLDTNLFQFGDMNFAVWFVLTAMAVLCGKYINKNLGWDNGAKFILWVGILLSCVSILLVTVFREYFNAHSATGENIILYVLRTVFLAGTGYLGMAFFEVKSSKDELRVQTEKLKFVEETIKDAKRESDLIVREAQVRANKIVNEAELNAKNIFLKKDRVEKELREFIQIEKELLKKYEENK